MAIDQEARLFSARLIRKKLRGSITEQAMFMLSKKDRTKVVWITTIQVFMGLLDLAGVVMIGALGALSIQGLESKAPGNKVSDLMRILHISKLSFQGQVAAIGIGAAILLVSKTIASIFFTRKTYFFLSRRGAQISAEMIARLLSQNLLKIQSRSSQQTLFMVTAGVQDLMIGVLATIIQVITDSSLLILMIIGLLSVDPVMALGTVSLFSVVGYSLYRLLQVRAKEIGQRTYKLGILSSEKILEVLNSYRESVVRNRRSFYANEIASLRYKMADTFAENAFMPYISKYVMDSTIVLGSLVLSAYEFATNNAVHALSIMALFLAASSRIAPAALRIQQGILILKNSSGAAEETLVLVKELEHLSLPAPDGDTYDFRHDGFTPDIEIKNLYFKYPSSENFALEDISIAVPAGSSIAFVGPSGAGKTTLVDLILGVLEPDKGEILISGKSPNLASISWPGAISYVPQNVVITNGTIRQNVGLGYPTSVASNESIENALNAAQLSKLITNLPEGIDAYTGENGSKLSGGQRQRLGIARALFTNPRLLVLDEATSALDGQTEADIGVAIQALRGHVTVLVVAHRLSTIRNSDQVVYMDRGKVMAVGTFEQVRLRIPDFDHQANLMGL